jgi:hypothetical protein
MARSPAAGQHHGLIGGNAMNEKKATPNNEAAPNKTQPQFKATGGSNDAAAQRKRALELLRTGPKSTLQLRRDADILSPAARVLELKRKGFNILTQWVHQPTDCGKLHRVALYVLLAEAGGHA